MELRKSQRSVFLKQVHEKRPRFEVFAPGRVNLIGEHTDYNGGKVLPFAIGLGISVKVTVQEREALKVQGEGPWLAVTSDFSEDFLFTPLSELLALAQPDSSSADLPSEIASSWAKYVVGAAIVFLEDEAARAGLRGFLSSKECLVFELSSSLPAGSGMSSSAALCCALMASLSLFSGAPYSAFEIAKRSMSVEHRFSGTKCGLMDQLAVMCSRSGGFTRIDFRRFPSDGIAEVEAVVAHPFFSRYTAVAIHTGVSHSLADSEYNLRRRSCEQALQILNGKTSEKAASLGDYALPEVFLRVFGRSRESMSQAQLKAALHSLLTGAPGDSEVLASCASHAILENARVDAGVMALSTGDAQSLDDAMRASHLSLRNDYRVSCPELDAACEVAREVGEKLGAVKMMTGLPVLGPRMTGGGFGGSTVQLVHNSILEDFVRTFAAESNPYTALTGKRPRLVVSGPQNGLRVAFL